MFKRNIVTSRSHSDSDQQRSVVRRCGDLQCLLAALIVILILVASIDFADAVSAPNQFPSQAHVHHKLRGLSAATSPAFPLKLPNTVRFYDNISSGGKKASDSSKYSQWSTAQLSAARYGLAATSLPSQGLALFACGWDKGILPYLFGFLINTD